MKKFNQKRELGSDNHGLRSKRFQAICSECGQQCEVPFRPTGDRPVFCDQCFGKHGGSNKLRLDKPRTDFINKKMFEAICDKCGKKCEVPFRPTGGKPIYCSDCFSKTPAQNTKGQESLKQQLEPLNAKLDQILMLLKGTESPKIEKLKVKKETTTKKNKTKSTVKRAKRK